MVLIYCKTVDYPKIVADYVCKANFKELNSENNSHIVKDENEDSCWIIQSKVMNETSAIIYQVGSKIVAIETDEDCASNIIEPLMKKYGFNNVKWLLTK